MPILLYQCPSSNNSRAVRMAAQTLGVELVLKFVDMWETEYLKPEFLRMNPQHSIPTIDDDGFYLWDGHAIMTYLVNKYAPDSPIYPTDPQKRAVVDRMLYFNIGTLSEAQDDFELHHVFRVEEKEEATVDEGLKKALGLLDEFLEKTTHVAGSHITVADYAILGTLTYLVEVCGFSVSAYSRVFAWMQKMKDEVPNYKEINEVPLRKHKENLRRRLPTFRPFS